MACLLLFRTHQGRFERWKRIATQKIFWKIVAEGGFSRLEQCAALADQGLKFSNCTVWRCFGGHGITLKKDSACE